MKWSKSIPSSSTRAQTLVRNHAKGQEQVRGLVKYLVEDLLKVLWKDQLGSLVKDQERSLVKCRPVVQDQGRGLLRKQLDSDAQLAVT